MKLLIITLIISMLSLPAVSFADDSLQISTSVPSEYTITVNTTVGGRINVSGIGYTNKKQFKVKRFSDFSATAVPDENYIVGKITADRLDGQKMTKYSISFSDICSDIVINIPFVKADAPPVITSASDDCVLKAGEDGTLSVTAESAYPLSYAWEISTDGGKVWAPAPFDSGTSSYDIRSASPMDEGSSHYLYRVTASDSRGMTVSKTIGMLVSDEYAYKRLTDSTSKIYASAYMRDETLLTLTRIDENSKEGSDIKLLLSKDTLPLMMYDVTLSGSGDSPYFGGITLEFNVGQDYNGQTLRVLHFHDDGTIDYHTATVSNGAMQITVESLSTFVVEIHGGLVHKVQVSSSAGGWVSVNGTEYAAADTDVTFNIIPDTGYLLESVTVNGEKRKTDGWQLTIPKIDGDMIIDVQFIPNEWHRHGVIAVPIIILTIICMLMLVMYDRIKIKLRP